jgi:hypothetical protein
VTKIAAKQTDKEKAGQKDRLSRNTWCPEEDSNLHASRH